MSELISVPDMATRPLVFDTSYWNGKLTAEQIKSTKCVLVIGRTGISWGYKDPLFDYYRELCKSINVAFAGYHVLYPSQPAKSQAEAVKKIIGDDPGSTKVPVWNDLELDQGVSANQMSDCCEEFGEILQSAFGGEKGIYSRASFINAYMPKRTWQNSYLWWLAQVLNGGVYHPGPYDVQLGLHPKQVVMIQNDWKGKIDGHSGDVDFSRWIRSDDELSDFLGVTSAPEPEQPMTLDELVAWLKAMHDDTAKHPPLK